LYDIDFDEIQEDTALRHELEEKAAQNGASYMHNWLSRLDPASAEEIHAHNVKRVIRAIEYNLQTGKMISEHNRQQHEKQSPYNFYYFVLHIDRAKLYDRIEKRIDKMLKEGLVEEVEGLRALGCKAGMTSMQGLGYKEILAYLNGEGTLEEAVYLLKRDTRHFAKRQLTWFRRERDVIWVDKEAFAEDETRICDYLIEKINEK
jgi:tRNA dimethylallyltransferase